MGSKLLAYSISGQTVGIDLPSWSNADVPDECPFKIISDEELTPSGYTEITSIENWAKYGLICAPDYAVMKFAIKDIIIEKGWSGITNTEKDMALEYFSYVDPADAIIYLMTDKGMSQGEAQYHMIKKWHVHHLKMIEAYTRRWHYAKFTVLLFLGREDGTDLFKTVKKLIDLYIELAVLGIDFNDYDNGIDDYIWSKNGFVGQGLEENNYTLLQGDWATFKETLSNVLVNGRYTPYTDSPI